MKASSRLIQKLRHGDGYDLKAVDLGMVPCEGLKSPEPRVPRKQVPICPTCTHPYASAYGGAVLCVGNCAGSFCNPPPPPLGVPQAPKARNSQRQGIFVSPLLRWSPRPPSFHSGFINLLPCFDRASTSAAVFASAHAPASASVCLQAPFRS